MDKTTIAIDREHRKVLGTIKKSLEIETGHFIDMDEVIKNLLDDYLRIRQLE